ncbi:hypothetical protein D0T85_01730 [Bacteroides sp. 519]|nr:hypothetical protein [Bacteroides sp. 519]
MRASIYGTFYRCPCIRG